MTVATPSQTALTVAFGIHLACRDHVLRHLFGEDALARQNRLIARTTDGARRLQALENPIHRGVARLKERFLLPGITSHYVLRKRMVRDASQAAVADGMTQVVVLGAGFDTATIGLAETCPGLRAFEIDTPATIEAKQQAAQGMIPSNLTLVAADLSDVALADLLGQIPGFDATAPTLFVCEGLLMYLSRVDVARTLRALRAAAPAGARLVMTAVPPMHGSESNVPALLRLYLRWLGEPLAWMESKATINAFLSQQGWQAKDVMDTRSMQTRYAPDRPDIGVHRGEYGVIAEAL